MLTCCSSCCLIFFCLFMYSPGVHSLVTLQGFDIERIEKKGREDQPLASTDVYIMTTVFINNTIYVNVSDPLANMTTVGMTTPCPTPDAAFLAKIKAITLVVISLVGFVIVGCLLCCMFYKNERLLNQLPWRRKPEETKHVFDMATMLAESAAAELGLDVEEILRGGPEGVLPYLEVMLESSKESRLPQEGRAQQEGKPLGVDSKNPLQEVAGGDPNALPQLQNYRPGTPHVLEHYSEPIPPPPAPPSAQAPLTSLADAVSSMSNRRPPRSMRQIARTVMVVDSLRATSMRPPPSGELGRANSRMGLCSASDNTSVGGLGLSSASSASAPGHGGILSSPYAAESVHNSCESLFLSDEEDMQGDSLSLVLTDTESLSALPIPSDFDKNDDDEFQDSLDTMS